VEALNTPAFELSDTSCRNGQRELSIPMLEEDISTEDLPPWKR
jgi:hypothetical protein